MRRIWMALAATATALGFATPAQAVDIPPIDTPEFVSLTYDLGATSLGGTFALGPVRLQSNAYVAMVPGLGGLGGVSGSMALRLTPRATGALTWGLAATGYYATGLTARGADLEGAALYPALVGTLPLGEHVVIRAAVGPMIFSGLSAWQDLPDGRRVRHGATGIMLLVPNAQLAWRLGGGSELTFGGFPSIVGWRYAL